MRRSVASSSSTPRDEVGGEERQRELHQLRGLQAELPEADPAARAHGVHAQARDEHDEEEGEGDEEQQGAEATQPPVVDTDGQPQHHDADGHPHRLADQDRVRRAVGVDGDDRRGRPDHDEPDDAEQRDVGQQHGRDRHLASADANTGRGRGGCGAVRLGAGRPGRGRRPAGGPARGTSASRDGARCASPWWPGPASCPPLPLGHGRAHQPGPTPDARHKSPPPSRPSGGCHRSAEGARQACAPRCAPRQVRRVTSRELRHREEVAVEDPEPQREKSPPRIQKRTMTVVSGHPRARSDGGWAPSGRCGGERRGS